MTTDVSKNINSINPITYQISYDVPDKTTILRTKQGLEEHQFLKSWASENIRAIMREYLLSHEATSPQKSIFLTNNLETITNFRELEKNLKQVLIDETERKLFVATKKKQELRALKLKQKVDWVKAHWDEVTPKIEYNKIEVLL